MIHTCRVCDTARNCGCGDCGESKLEICTKCNNVQVLSAAKHEGIPISHLAQDPLGGYHFKPNQIKDHRISMTEKSLCHSNNP